MNYKEARKFVHDWLWNPGPMQRQTKGMPWGEEYIEDAAQMIVSATAQQAVQADGLTQCPKCRGCLESEWHLF
jgi:hypothetical protein